MAPYVDLTYFLFLLYPLALLVLLGLVGWLGAPAILFVSAAVLVFQYADPLGTGAQQAEGLRQLELLAGYAVASVVVVTAFALVRRRGASRPAFYAAVALALAPLVVVKVAPLIAPRQALFGLVAAAPGASAGVAAATPPPGLAPPPGALEIVGFLGVSYVTFRLIDVIVDLHDGIVSGVPSPMTLLGYLLFAPTISAGPIDRYKRFCGDLCAPRRTARAYLVDVEAGIHRIAQGFLYKFILGYLVYQYVLLPLDAQSGVLAMVGYMYAYAFYLFFDFAGYSAFAIGAGRFFGVRVPENFDRPFASRTFREVWDRWHITLSWWLRDHVYMRFMLKAGRAKWFGGDRVRASHVGLLLTMLLMGLWHGLYPHYVVYGLYQGAMLVVYDAVGRWNARRRLIPSGRLVRLGQVALTFDLFCFGLLIFSGHLFT